MSARHAVVRDHRLSYRRQVLEASPGGKRPVKLGRYILMCMFCCAAGLETLIAEQSAVGAWHQVPVADRIIGRSMGGSMGGTHACFAVSNPADRRDWRLAADGRRTV